jgi:short-subunit dehydrogenase
MHAEEERRPGEYDSGCVADPDLDRKPTAVVTGASSGIGAAIARELVARGHSVTVVARDAGRLSRTVAELAAAESACVEQVACDVATAAGRATLVATLRERRRDVELLVNNAGIGSAGRFQELASERETAMVATNCEAVVALCSAFLPAMVERGRGGILNTASIGGFQPLPRQATYSATKAFVLTFGDALTADLAGTGVTVTTLCPGPVPTPFWDAEGMEISAMPTASVRSAAEVAARAVDGVERGRRVVVPGLVNKLSALSGRWTPRALLLPLLQRTYPVGRGG